MATKYLQQDAVVNRLQQNGRKILRDRVELPASDLVTKRWEAVKADIMAYAAGVWSQHGAEQGPAYAEMAKHRIDTYMGRELQAFHKEVDGILKTAKRQAYLTQYMTSTWVMDQVTPPIIKVRPPRSIVDAWKNRPDIQPKVRRARESWFTEPVSQDTTPQSPQDAERAKDQGEATGGERAEGWLKGWHAATMGALVLAGVQGATAQDVQDRISGATADGRDIGCPGAPHSVPGPGVHS
jgi:hypothetical protein